MSSSALLHTPRPEPRGESSPGGGARGWFPSRSGVTALLRDLFELVHPGFGGVGDRGTTRAPGSRRTPGSDPGAGLAGGIADALGSSDAARDVRARSADVAEVLLDGLPALRAAFRGDVRAAYEGDPAAGSVDEVVCCYPGIEAVTTYRLAHVLWREQVPILPRMMSEVAHSRTGIDIHPGAEIGRRFFIDHGTGVVIGQTTRIGDGVRLYQGVTLGALNFPRDERGRLIRNRRRHPTLEDDVVVYANATILGGDTVVGHDSIIGSNVWLIESVPPYTMVSLERPTLRYRHAAGGGERQTACGASV